VHPNLLGSAGSHPPASVPQPPDIGAVSGLQWKPGFAPAIAGVLSVSLALTPSFNSPACPPIEFARPSAPARAPSGSRCAALVTRAWPCWCGVRCALHPVVLDWDFPRKRLFLSRNIEGATARVRMAAFQLGRQGATTWRHRRPQITAAPSTRRHCSGPRTKRASGRWLTWSPTPRALLPPPAPPH
jgi:hypothetical protein